MSRRRQRCALCSVSITVLAVATSVILVSGAATEPSPASSNNLAQSRPPRKFRNLALQPEAAAVNRRLGNRFKSGNAPTVLTGGVTVGGERQLITIIRRQTDYGENVELLLAGRRFTWSDADGIKATQSAATEAERLLVERLVFDQFVLGQLRGASYQTIVQNLRLTAAGDHYNGPLWTMVRTNDPRAGDNAAPKSSWRLYYINSNSGLIDRIECEVDGQSIAASIVQWTEQNGEKIPSHIRWTANSQTLMEFQLTSFSQNQ